jgi:hypothetical protein
LTQPALNPANEYRVSKQGWVRKTKTGTNGLIP